MCVVDWSENGPCDCIGHMMPGVYHVVACCDVPHIDSWENEGGLVGDE